MDYFPGGKRSVLAEKDFAFLQCYLALYGQQREETGVQLGDYLSRGFL